MVAVLGVLAALLPTSAVGAQTLPTVSIEALQSRVTEGGTARFRLTVSPAGALTVFVSVGETGSFVSQTAINALLVAHNVPAGGSLDLEVPTLADSTDEIDGSISVSVTAQSTYRVAAAPNNSADVKVIDDDATVVSIAGGGALLEGDTTTPNARTLVSLGRQLGVGEVVDVPIILLSRTGTLLNQKYISEDITEAERDTKDIVDLRVVAVQGTSVQNLGEYRTIIRDGTRLAQVIRFTAGSQHAVVVTKVTGRDEQNDGYLKRDDGTEDTRQSVNKHEGIDVVFNETALNSRQLGTNVSGRLAMHPHRRSALLRISDDDYVEHPHVLRLSGSKAPGSLSRLQREGRRGVGIYNELYMPALNAWSVPRKAYVTEGGTPPSDCARAATAEEASYCYQVRLTIPPSGNVTVTPTNSDPGAVTITPTTLSFTVSDWKTPKWLKITPVDDADGDDETVEITLGLSNYYDLTEDRDNEMTITVADDDKPEVVSITGGGTIRDGDANSTTQVSVSLAGPLPPGSTVTVPLSLTTNTGAALPGSSAPDFTVAAAGGGVAATGLGSATPSLTFTGSDQVTVQTATLTFAATAGTDADSADELVTVGFGALGAGVAAHATDTSALVAIAENTFGVDLGAGTATSATATVAEGAKTEIFVTASRAPTAPLRVPIMVRSQGTTAAVGSDFTVAGGAEPLEVVIPAGATTGKVELQALSDDADEQDETVVVAFPATMPPYISGTPTRATATVTISDRTPTSLTLSAPAGAVAENGGTKTLTVTLGRALMSSESVTVPLVVTGATANTHYTVALQPAVQSGVTLITANPHSAQNPAVRLTAGARAATLRFTMSPNSDLAVRTVTVNYGTGNRAPGHSSNQNLAGGVSAAGAPQYIGVIDDEIDAPVEVASDWALRPPDVVPGGTFRLLFVTSTLHPATSPRIDDYNGFVQARAAAGHSAVRTHSSRFRAVGSTAAVNAKENTATSFSNSDRGEPIYWLGGGGDRVADNYADFYDGSWANISEAREEDGDAHDIDTLGYWTGSLDAGTPKLGNTLGSADVVLGFLHSRVLRPLGGSGASGDDIGGTVTGTTVEGFSEFTEEICEGIGRFQICEDFTRMDPLFGQRHLYALSPVFRVAAPTAISIADTAAAEGSDLRFTVTLASAAPSGGVTINYTVSDGRGEDDDEHYNIATASGADGSDYTPPASGASITIAQGRTTGTITVRTVQDDVYESDHYLTVTLTSASANRTISATANKGVGKITDSDDLPTVRFERGTYSFGEDKGHAALKIVRSGASELPVVVHYRTVPNTAQAGRDFARVSAKVTFDADENEKTIRVVLYDNRRKEGARSFFVYILEPVENGKLFDNRSNIAVVSILDNEPSIWLTVPRGGVVDEGDTIPIVLNVSEPVTAPGGVSETLARAGGNLGDYSLSSTTISIPRGSLTGTVTLTATQDSAAEDYETVILRIPSQTPIGRYNPSDPTLVLITIRDDDGGTDGYFTLSADKTRVTEGETVTLTAARAFNITNAVTVPLTAIAARTTAASGDYSVAASIAVGANRLSGSTVLTAGDDSDDEPSETIRIAMGTLPSGAQKSVPNLVDLVIVDDDPTTVTLANSDNTVAENAGTSTITVIVGRRLVAGEVLVVPLRFSGTATRGTDYTLAGTPATGVKYGNLAAGAPIIRFTGSNNTATTATVTLTARQDDDDEGTSETIVVSMGTPQHSDGDGGLDGGVTPTGGPFTVQLSDDDSTAVSVAISAPPGAVAEAAGTKDITIRLGRALTGSETVTVPLTVSGVTVTTDFTLGLQPATQTGVTLLTSGSHSAQNPAVRLAAGATQAILRFTAVANNDRSQPYAVVDFGTGARAPAASGLSIGTPTGAPLGFAITDDETGAIEVPLAWPLKPAGSSVLHGEKFRLLFVTSGTRDASPTSIDVYNDFVRRHAATGHASLRPYAGLFAAVGSTSTVDARDNTMTTYTAQDKGVPVYWVLGPKAADEYEDFYDGSWDNNNVSLNHPKNEAGANAGGDKVFTGSRNDGTKVSNLLALGGTAANVQAGRHATNGNPSWSPLSQIAEAKTSTLPFYALSPVLTVADDRPTVSVTAGAGVTEGTAASFTVEISAAQSNNVTVNLAVAQAGSVVDSANLGNKTVTITAGQTSVNYSVATVADSVDEPDGEVTVTVRDDRLYVYRSDPDDASATVAVADDDATTATMAAAAGAIAEAGGTKAVTVTLSRLLVTGESLAVPLTFAGTATRGTDYSAAETTASGVTYANLNSGSASVTFTGNDTPAMTSRTATVTLTATDDDVDEGASETVTVTFGTLAPTGLSGGATGAGSPQTVTITDDDTKGLTLTAPADVAEDGGTSTFTVVLDTQPTAAVTVTVTSGNTSAATVSPSSLTFNPTGSTNLWSSPQTVTITGVNDNVDNAGDERTVTITATPSGGGYGNSERETTTVDVTDDDTKGLTLTAPADVAEDGGTSTFTVVLDTQPTAAVTVTVTSGSTSAATVSPSSLTFNPTGSTNLWSSPQTVTITGVNDNVDNSDDKRTVTITATPSGGGYGNSESETTTVDVTDDDGPALPVLTVTAGSAVTEAANVSASFTIAADTAPTTNLTVNLTVSQTGDFVSASNRGSKTVTLTSGSTSVTYTVPVVNDSADEPSGSVTLSLSAGTGYTVGSASSASVAVSDDEATTVSVTVAAGDLAEGASRNVVVSLGRKLAAGEALAVPLTFAGTATFGTDYTLAATAAQNSGLSFANLTGTYSSSTPPTVTFTGAAAQGSLADSATVVLTASVDSVIEATDESVQVGVGTLTATNLDGGTTLTDTTPDFDITDATVQLTFAVERAAVVEGSTMVDPNDSNARIPVPASYTVTVQSGTIPTGGLTIPISVNPAPAQASDASSADYGSPPSSIMLASGATSATVSLSITDDNIDELSERIRFVPGALPNGYQHSGSAFDARSSSVTITDDDPTTVSFTGSRALTILEGSTTSTATLTVTFSRALKTDPLYSNAAETVTVPLNLTTTTGATISGSANRDFNVTATGTGVVLSGATTATPTLTFTGHATNTVRTATVTFTATSRDDGDTIPETVNIAIGTVTSQFSGLSVPIDGGAEAGSPSTATLTIADSSAATTATLSSAADASSVTLQDSYGGQLVGEGGPTAKLRVTLGRALGSGESATFPLQTVAIRSDGRWVGGPGRAFVLGGSLAGGVTLGTDVTLALDGSPSGVALTGGTTASPSLSFTGGASASASATLIVSAVANNASHPDDRIFAIGFGTPTLSGVAITTAPAPGSEALPHLVLRDDDRVAGDVIVYDDTILRWETPDDYTFEFTEGGRTGRGKKYQDPPRTPANYHFDRDLNLSRSTLGYRVWFVRPPTTSVTLTVTPASTGKVLLAREGGPFAASLSITVEPDDPAGSNRCEAPAGSGVWSGDQSWRCSVRINVQPLNAPGSADCVTISHTVSGGGYSGVLGAGHNLQARLYPDYPNTAEPSCALLTPFPGKKSGFNWAGQPFSWLWHNYG